VLQLHSGKIYASTGDSQNSEIITFYNLTKGGVDVVDRMCAAFSRARNTRRWPMGIFYSFLNVAEMNAFILFFLNKLSKMLRIIFLKELSLELFKEQLTIRATTSCLSREVQEKAAKLTGKHDTKEKPEQGK
jgi:hypothetical protein